MAWTILPKAPSTSDVIAIGLMADISMVRCPLRDRSESRTRAVVRNSQLEAQLKTVYNGACRAVPWFACEGPPLLGFYARPRATRIADPADPSRIFSWLICK